MAHRRVVAREYLEALLIAIVFALFVRTFLLQAFKIPTPSMEENLVVGDHLLVNKFIFGRAAPGTALAALLPARPIRRGDVVVFKFPLDPRRDFIKRCVGLAGDTVELVDKVLFVNGREVLDEGYAAHEDPRVFSSSPFLREAYRHRDNFGPYTVPADRYFCLGDNRDHSNDSRFWGTVPADHVKGRGLLVYWSLAAAREDTTAAGERGKIGPALDGPLRWLRDSRWERSFLLVR